MHARPGGARRGPELLDSDPLRRLRTGLQPRARVLAAAQLLARERDRRLVLAVRGDEEARRRGCRERGLEIVLAQMAELLYTARTEECLHAHDAARGELAQARLVRVHEPTPQREVDDRAARRGLVLRVESVRVERRRDRIERHVRERGDPAGGRATRRGEPTLPLGAARLVDVRVRVDDTRQDDETARIDLVARLTLARLGGALALEEEFARAR